MTDTVTESIGFKGNPTHHRTRQPQCPITRSQVILALALLFLLNLLLRVFYLRYDFVNGDEGVRALTAVQMLDGARLYVDVVTDKSPGATFFYAAVFAGFGRSMKSVHLAAIVWNYLTALMVYAISARFVSRRVGLWAAFLFVYFSTNYFTQDMMAANTELLMALPYSAAFFLFLCATISRPSGRGGTAAMHADRQYMLLMASGALAGVSMLVKQTGVLQLGFCLLFEVATMRSAYRAGSNISTLRSAGWASARRLLAVAIGFIAAMGVFVWWLAWNDASRDFWRNAVQLNTFYVEPKALGVWLRLFVGRGIGFVLFNAALWAPAVIASVRFFRHRRTETREIETKASHLSQFTLATVLWCVVSLSAVVISGRFFGHYFIPALMPLSVLAALELGRMRDQPRMSTRERVAISAVAVAFVFGVVRFHHRTAILAYETLTGVPTHWSQQWGMSRRQAEAEIVSQQVRARVAPREPLYIWGYAHDVYWRTGCRPASRYLTPYYIDGRFPDAESISAPPQDQFFQQAQANLIEDLRKAKPRLILEVYGRMRDLPYPPIVEFITANYREVGNAGPDPSRPFRMLELVDAR
jgi:4-amino-4-deoxy-L-arabinose transferase-like glycosyltransferase